MTCSQRFKTWRTKIKACKKCVMKEKEEQQEIHQQQCKLQDMEAELKTREARSTEMEIKIQDMIDEAHQRNKQMLYENEQQEEIQ